MSVWQLNVGVCVSRKPLVCDREPCNVCKHVGVGARDASPGAHIIHWQKHAPSPLGRSLCPNRQFTCVYIPYSFILKTRDTETVPNLWLSPPKVQNATTGLTWDAFQISHVDASHHCLPDSVLAGSQSHALWRGTWVSCRLNQWARSHLSLLRHLQICALQLPQAPYQAAAGILPTSLASHPLLPYSKQMESIVCELQLGGKKLNYLKFARSRTITCWYGLNRIWFLKLMQTFKFQCQLMEQWIQSGDLL